MSETDLHTAFYNQRSGVLTLVTKLQSLTLLEEPIEHGSCALYGKFENLIYQIQYANGDWANACLNCGYLAYEKFDKDRRAT